MKDNLRLAIAGRRNRQKRDWDGFKRRFKESVGIDLEDRQLIEPATSVTYSRELSQTIQNRLDAKTLKRLPELHWEDVANLVREFCKRNNGKELIAFLANYEDFLFKLPAATFEEVARSMVLFDGDTLYFAGADLGTGIGIDVYKSELTHEQRFEVDLW